MEARSRLKFVSHSPRSRCQRHSCCTQSLGHHHRTPHRLESCKCWCTQQEEVVEAAAEEVAEGAARSQRSRYQSRMRCIEPLCHHHHSTHRFASYMCQCTCLVRKVAVLKEVEKARDQKVESHSRRSRCQRHSRCTQSPGRHRRSMHRSESCMCLCTNRAVTVAVRAAPGEKEATAEQVEHMILSNSADWPS